MQEPSTAVSSSNPYMTPPNQIRTLHPAASERERRPEQRPGENITTLPHGVNLENETMMRWLGYQQSSVTPRVALPAEVSAATAQQIQRETEIRRTRILQHQQHQQRHMHPHRHMQQRQIHPHALRHLTGNPTGTADPRGNVVTLATGRAGGSRRSSEPNGSGVLDANGNPFGSVMGGRAPTTQEPAMRPHPTASLAPSSASPSSQPVPVPSIMSLQQGLYVRSHPNVVIPQLTGMSASANAAMTTFGGISLAPNAYIHPSNAPPSAMTHSGNPRPSPAFPPSVTLSFSAGVQQGSRTQTQAPAAPTRTSGQSTASLHPQFRSKAVCRLSCRHCGTQVCSRGMRAILLGDTRVELYSTDAAPPADSVQLVGRDYVTKNCHCRIRDIACLGW
ncbi:Protein fam72a [Phlyctochytrium bullatum]|nr:Protein fam72a [Phlyctochytrium bullatum]